MYLAGVQYVPISGKISDAFLWGLLDKWAQFNVHPHPSNLCVSRKRQCECVTVAIDKNIEVIPSGICFFHLFPALTEGSWKGPRFLPRFSGLQRHGAAHWCWVVPQGSPGRFDARTRLDVTKVRWSSWSSLKRVAFWSVFFSHVSCNSEAQLLNILAISKFCSLIHGQVAIHVILCGHLQGQLPHPGHWCCSSQEWHAQWQHGAALGMGTDCDVQFFKVHEGSVSFHWGIWFNIFHLLSSYFIVSKYKIQYWWYMSFWKILSDISINQISEDPHQVLLSALNLDASQKEALAEYNHNQQMIESFDGEKHGWVPETPETDDPSRYTTCWDMDAESMLNIHRRYKILGWGWISQHVHGELLRG